MFPMTTNISKIGFLFIFLFSVQFLFAQKESEKLKKKQKELQKKIENTKGLIGKTRDAQTISIAELAIINQQIAYRDELIGNYAQQVSRIEAEIENNKESQIVLQKDLQKQKKRYIDLVRYAYRHRNSYHRLLFVFASESFNQAYMRVKYLQQFGEHRKKQGQLIRKKQRELTALNEKLKSDKSQKQSLLGKQEVEKQNYQEDKVKQQETLGQLKNEESRLKSELTDQVKMKEKLNAEIKKVIEEEIRKEREREREAEARRKKNASGNAKKTNAKKTNDNSTNAKKDIHYDINTPEIEPESAEFEKNRGRLPWPVEKGEIVSYFGRNPHPTLAGVVTNNNGVDIGTTKGSQVRSVFNGKVTSVFLIPNAGKCVIISHGAYRTVYANLAEVQVIKGQEVKTKQQIGTLLPGENGALSEAHFEVWKVTSEDMEKQNPSMWLYR